MTWLQKVWTFGILVAMGLVGIATGIPIDAYGMTVGPSHSRPGGKLLTDGIVESKLLVEWKKAIKE